jgi:hypothetical protein
MRTIDPTGEAKAISWSMAAVTVVVSACLCILAVASLLFALAELRAHWPG